MAKEINIVPIKEACRLWQRDERTLKKWALEGTLLFDIVGKKDSRKSCWYIETPEGRYNRLHND